MVAVTPFTPDQWPVYRTLRLASLQDTPDAFGATFAEQRDWPAVLWQMRLQAGVDALAALPLLADVDGTPAGLAWGKHETDGVHIYQLWVAPAHRGRGIARLLLDTLIAWARTTTASTIHLSVTTSATTRAATRLYLRTGFTPIGSPAPLRENSPLLSQPMHHQLGSESN